MIFKRDLAANGVTQLEAMFSSIISTFCPAPSCSPLPLREDGGCPPGSRLEQNFSSQFSLLPKQGFLWKDSFTGLWMYIRPVGSQCYMGRQLQWLRMWWAPKERTPQFSSGYLSHVCKKPCLCVSWLDLQLSNVRAPIKPSVFSPLSVEAPPVILRRVLN